MDLTVIIGIVLGWACVIICLFLEGNRLSAFLSVSAFILVIGGSLGATLVGFKFSDIPVIVKAFIAAVFPRRIDYAGSIATLKDLATQARRSGVLSLEDHIASQKDEFLKAGLQLAVDGADSEVIRKILETKASIIEEKKLTGSFFFEKMGGFTPTLGIVGTVLGLVKVLEHLTEPEKLGAGIAEAFVATLYGIASANLFFCPLRQRLGAT
jgi:chemotaxis protein MotA